MKRVLVVSYYYPPYGSVGATRVSKMTRYLAEHGWEATVLTVAHDDRPEEIDLEIPVERIHRVRQAFDVTALPRWLMGRKTVEKQRFGSGRGWKADALWRVSLVYRNVACFPDPQIGWLHPAVREGRRILAEIQPDVILSSSFPNTSHLVARRLAIESGVPWVAEMRDLWTDNHNFQRFRPLRAIEQELERRTIGKADAIVTVSDVWAELLRHRFGKPTYVVPNGFDPSDYSEQAPPAAGLFTLVYTGMFYNGKQNPDPLLEAVAALSRAGVINPRTFRLQLVGHYLGPVLARAEVAGVLPFVTLDSPVPYRESLRRQRGATALLFLDWADPNESGWYSAKIYEYLGARRPVLSIGPHHSVVARLLEQTRAGVVAESSLETVEVLRDWILTFQASGELHSHSSPEMLRRFQRQVAAKNMATVLDTVGADERRKAR